MPSFFLGVAFADNLTVAYIAGLIGGIGNACLNGGVIPAAMEIFVGRSAFCQHHDEIVHRYRPVHPAVHDHVYGFGSDAAHDPVLLVPGLSALSSPS